MAFLQNKEGRQLQVVPYSGRNEDDNKNENNEKQEDESENDVDEIASLMPKASKEIRLKMDECKEVSIGQTTNYHIHFHDSKPDTTEVLQRLISTASSQSSIDSNGPFTPLTSSCDSGIGQPTANIPFSSGINFNPYFPSYLINAERARTQSNCTEDKNGSLMTSDEYLSEGRRHSYDSVVGNEPSLKRQLDNPSTSSTNQMKYDGRNASNDVNKITHPPASLYLSNSQTCGQKPCCSRIKLTKEAKAPNHTADTPRKRIHNNWRKMETSFVALGDYSLGIEPGEFYESVLEEGCYVVAMENGTQYRIKLTNNSRLRCNVDVHVDEKLVAELQMQENDWHFLPGPIRNGKICGQFIFLRAKDAPEEAEIDPYSKSNGIVTAVFTPEKVKSPTDSTRHIPEENFQAGLGDILSSQLKTLGLIEKKTINEKTINQTSGGSRSCADFCGGATALVAYNEKQMPIEDAEEIEVDEDKAVKITLRLVARKSDDMFVPQVNKPIKPLKSTRCPPSFDP